ncbi:hypothetical protein EW145_g38 [Phellinidium pouzarii]|uniref:Uncharacterized protein n=1 Tax=Phellinidium pouzarii TaxID=167371 RepID=A0A4S4LLS8_9AGAM|nr:hypothetical protein EW145_g38 [Phellinidium pouzarii]
MSAPGEPASSKPLQRPVDPQLLDRINSYLHTLTSQEILKWALETLPNLFQTTAFGLTGLVQLDMLNKITANPPPLIFIDTLYHFNETLELVEEVKQRYGREVHVYKSEGCDTVADFEAKHGERVWEREEATYDYLVKVEPARRAYAELNVQSVITGRRASQGASRQSLQPLEVDSTGLFKLNPLFSWKFSAVQTYIVEHNVPRNVLLDRGYKSVGDWHSTQRAGEGDEGERAGRWAGRTEKTECGLHEDYFALRLQVLKKKREAELRQKDEERGDEIRVAHRTLALAGPGSRVQLSGTFVCRRFCLKSRRSLSETQCFVHARHRHQHWLFRVDRPLSTDSSASSSGSGSPSDAFVAPEPPPVEESANMVVLRIISLHETLTRRPNLTGRLPQPPDIHNQDVYHQVFTHRSVFARSKHEFEDLPNDPAPDNEVSLKYEFPKHLHSHNSQTMAIQRSAHIQADVFEAYIGGVYIDRGISVVSDWIKVLFLPYVKEAYRIVRGQYGLTPQREIRPLSPPSSPNFSGAGGGHNGSQRPLPSGSDLDRTASYSAGGLEASGSFLSLFNQHCQQQNKLIEWVYGEVKGEGTNVTPIWSVQARIDGRLYATGQGSTKKAAQNEAAKNGLVKLGLVRA